MLDAESERYSVQGTPKRGLRQVDFVFEGNEIRGLGTKSADQIPVGADGTLRQEGDAIPQRRALRGKRGGWQGELLR